MVMNLASESNQDDDWLKFFLPTFLLLGRKLIKNRENIEFKQLSTL